MIIESVSTMSYHDLQDTLDKVVGKIGLSSTIRLLKKVVHGQGVEASETHKVKLITSYLILQSQVVFHLEEKDFFSSNTREYRDGRMVCYHLLKKYTDASYSRIAELFSQHKRSILYHHQKCVDLLSVEQFQKSFSEKYRTLENSLLEFIAKLNAKHTNEESNAR